MSYTDLELLFANNASTTLGSALSSGATSLTVASGTGSEFPLPSPGQAFVVTLVPSDSVTGVPNEVVLCTSRTGDVLTIVRGQEGTTPTAYNVGDTVAMFPTEGTMSQFAQPRDTQQQAGNVAADSGTTNAGVVTLSPAPAALSDLEGVPIRVLKTGTGNTGPYTLNVNTLGAIPILQGGRALTGGELPANTYFDVLYNAAGHFDLMSGLGYQVAVPSAIQAASYISGIDGGSAANVYTLDLTPAWTASPSDFMTVNIRLRHTNTGASTLAVGGGSAFPILKFSGGTAVDVAANDLINGHSYILQYNGGGTPFWQVMSPLG